MAESMAPEFLAGTCTAVNSVSCGDRIPARKLKLNAHERCPAQARRPRYRPGPNSTPACLVSWRGAPLRISFAVDARTRGGNEDFPGVDVVSSGWPLRVRRAHRAAARADVGW